MASAHVEPWVFGIEAGATADMKLNGKLDDAGALAGDWAFSEYNGTFKATRPSATPVSAPAAGSSETNPSSPSNPQ